MRIALIGGIPIGVGYRFSNMWTDNPISFDAPEAPQTVYKPLRVKPLAMHDLRTKPRRQSVMRGK